MMIEIVTHCWRYSRLLRYQLDSLALHYWRQPSDLRVSLTVHAAPDDQETLRLATMFRHCPVLWILSPAGEVKNRNIGRNYSAIRTTADWVWFADADYVFGPSSLESLRAAPDCGLCYPQWIRASINHATGQRYVDAHPHRDIDPVDFAPVRLRRAIGGAQIVPGELARQVGYNPDPRWQQPVRGELFADTRGDRAARVRLGGAGTPIDLPNVYRIRHERAGRFEPVAN